MNKNYRIYYKEGTREEILDFLRNYSNDILINTIDNDSIGITIENENEEEVYQDIKQKLEPKLSQKNQ